MRLWLVRHAQPRVDPGVCYGALDMGTDRAATQSAAQTLAAALPFGLPVAASPRLRCQELALALQTMRPDLVWHTDARIAEMNFGTWEGQRWDALDPSELQAWTDHFADWACGGAESANDLMERVDQAWSQWLRSGHDGVWLTHAGVIRAVALLAKGHRRLTRAEQWPRDAPAYGQWRIVDVPRSQARASGGHLA